MRQLVLDTETTGLEPKQGHRIIEIGCVELLNRRLTGNNLHLYINPQRAIDAGAQQVHGITAAFLADKPTFAQIDAELTGYLRDAELIIHNAPFDVGFLDHEFRLLNAEHPSTADLCKITDSLVMARRKHAGQRNSLDALCKRYEVDNTGRELHGALLDAELLAEVYLRMTGGQARLSLGGGDDDADGGAATQIRRLSANRPALVVRSADEKERAAHTAFLDNLDKLSNGACLWRQST